VGDLPNEAKALLALANLWDTRGDREQAAGVARQALAVQNRLSDLVDRSIAHLSLAVFLFNPRATAQAARHLLAGLTYALLMGHGPIVKNVLHNLAIDLRHAAASGGQYELPRLAELLARPGFEPLQRTLTERNVALDALQAQIDQHVEGVWRLEEEGS
jgi:hypothetical protein